MKKTFLLIAGLLMLAACTRQDNTQSTDTISSSSTNSTSHYNSTAPPAPAIVGTPAPADTPKTKPGASVPNPNTTPKSNRDTVNINIQ